MQAIIEYHNEEGVSYGSFEVFWANEGVDDVHNGPGWYWWACFPGCMPDSDPCGPFATSTQAMNDADYM